jgi:hypothetical protein
LIDRKEGEREEREEGGGRRNKNRRRIFALELEFLNNLWGLGTKEE